MKNSPSTTEETTASPVQYITLKNAIAAKLGKHADGSINYTVSCNPGRTVLFISITDNSNAGYFSREYVAFDRIHDLVSKLDRSTFTSKLLKDAFAGKSSNNAGFLAAVLHAEGLITRARDDESKHTLAGNWASWKTGLLTSEGSYAGATASSDAPTISDKHKAPTVKHAKPANSVE